MVLSSDVNVALYMMHFLWHFPFRGQLALTAVAWRRGVAGVGFSF